MSDTETQIRQLEEANVLLKAHPEFLPQILASMLTIVRATHDPIVLHWCLGFVSNILRFGSALDIGQKMDCASHLTDTFVHIIKHTNSPLLSQTLLLRKFVAVAIDLYEIAFYRLAVGAKLEKAEDATSDPLKPDDATSNVLKSDGTTLNVWHNILIIKKFLVTLWDGSYPLIPLEQESCNDESITQSTPVKLLLLKFIFRIIEIQSEAPPKDPRKRRQRGKEAPVSLHTLTASLLTDASQASLKQELTAEARQLLQYILSLLVYKKNLGTQVTSSIFFLMIKLIQKRPGFLKHILQELSKFSLDGMLPVEKEMFLLNLNDENDNFYRLKFKLEKRFILRSYKIFLDFLFRNKFLNAFVKKDANTDETVYASLSDFDKTSLSYLNKINRILQIQSHERANKNLLKDLQHDNFTDIVEKTRALRKRRFDPLNNGLDRLQTPPSKKILYRSLFSKVHNGTPFEFDVSALTDQGVLISMVLISLQKASVAELTAKLEAVGDAYVDIIEQEDDVDNSTKRMKLANELDGSTVEKDLSNGNSDGEDNDDMNKVENKENNGSKEVDNTKIDDKIDYGTIKPIVNEESDDYDVELQYAESKLNSTDDSEDEYDPESIAVEEALPDQKYTQGSVGGLIRNMIGQQPKMIINKNPPQNFSQKKHKKKKNKPVVNPTELDY